MILKEYEISQTEQPAGAPFHCPPHSPCRILVVDDELYIRQLNTMMLARFGYMVDAAEDGAAAWQALNAESYDLLITDNNMPKVSGVELLKKVSAARMALPVIMATGVVPEHEFSRHPGLQPAALLLKPYTTAELLGKVQEVLRMTSDVPERSAPRPDWPRSTSPMVCRFDDSNSRPRV